MTELELAPRENMRIIIDVPAWIKESAKEELYHCIESICHLFSDGDVEVHKDE